MIRSVLNYRLAFSFAQFVSAKLRTMGGQFDSGNNEGLLSNTTAREEKLVTLGTVWLPRPLLFVLLFAEVPFRATVFFVRDCPLSLLGLRGALSLPHVFLVVWKLALTAGARVEPPKKLDHSDIFSS